MRRREEINESRKEEAKDSINNLARTDNPFYGKQLADLIQEIEGASPNIRNIEIQRDNFLKDPDWLNYTPAASATLKRKTNDLITDLLEVQHKLGAAMSAIHELNERLSRYGS